MLKSFGLDSRVNLMKKTGTTNSTPLLLSRIGCPSFLKKRIFLLFLIFDSNPSLEICLLR